MAASTSRKEPRCPGSAPWMEMDPPVTAAAMAKVPASSRSLMTRCSVPPRRSTPSISSRCGAVRSIRAPMERSMATRSSVSGSCAAFSITVVPRASTAASMAFSVPITVT